MRTAASRHEKSHSVRKAHKYSWCIEAFHRRDHCKGHEATCRGAPLPPNSTPQQDLAQNGHFDTGSATTGQASSRDASTGLNTLDTTSAALDGQNNAHFTASGWLSQELFSQINASRASTTTDQISPSNSQRSSFDGTFANSCQSAEASLTLEDPALQVQQPGRSQDGIELHTCTQSGCSQCCHSHAAHQTHTSQHHVTQPLGNDQGDYHLGIAPTKALHALRRRKHPQRHACPMCPKSFTRSASLKEHICTHIDIRSFPCSVCGKTFTRRPDWKRHERLHSGEKKFICRGELTNSTRWGCGRRFSRMDALREIEDWTSLSNVFTRR